VITERERERERERVCVCFRTAYYYPVFYPPTVFVCFELFSEHYLRLHYYSALRAPSLYAILFYRPDDRALRRHSILALHNTALIGLLSILTGGAHEHEGY